MTKCPKRELCSECNKEIEEGKIRVMKGEIIHESHCDHMQRARTNKFRGRIENLMNLAMFTQFGKGKYKI